MRKFTESTKVEGFILKRVNYKDADKIITIFTKELGKITCTAKGIRKIESKKKSHLDTLNKVSLFLIKSSNWYIVTQAEAVATYPNIKKDINKINYAILIFELASKLLNDDEQDNSFYQLIDTHLNFLNERNNLSELQIAVSFFIKALELSGHYETNECSQIAHVIYGLGTLEFMTILEKYQNPLQSIGEEQDTEKLSLGLQALLMYLDQKTQIRLKSQIII